MDHNNMGDGPIHIHGGKSTSNREIGWSCSSFSEMAGHKYARMMMEENNSEDGEMDIGSVKEEEGLLSRGMSSGGRSKKLVWTEEEDATLKKALEENGVQQGCSRSTVISCSWGDIAKFLPGRTAKQCRERWCYNLDPTIRRDTWTLEEDAILMKTQQQFGNHWAAISRQLKGRTENSVKIRFKSIKRAQRRFWSKEEDAKLMHMYRTIGSKWDVIASKLDQPRTRNAVKTRCLWLKRGEKEEPLAPGAPEQLLRNPEILNRLDIVAVGDDIQVSIKHPDEKKGKQDCKDTSAMQFGKRKLLHLRTSTGTTAYASSEGEPSSPLVGMMDIVHPYPAPISTTPLSRTTDAFETDTEQTPKRRKMTKDDISPRDSNKTSNPDRLMSFAQVVLDSSDEDEKPSPTLNAALAPPQLNITLNLNDIVAQALLQQLNQQPILQKLQASHLCQQWNALQEQQRALSMAMMMRLASNQPQTQQQQQQQQAIYPKNVCPAPDMDLFQDLLLVKSKQQQSKQ